MRVFKNAWFSRFARKEKISDQALWEAVDRAEQGLIDADLGGGVIKQRIARTGAGRSGGYRSLVLYRKGSKAFFVFGFSKNSQGNIRDDEQEQFKRAAKVTLGLTQEQLRSLIEKAQMEEIFRNA
ncbi:MAG: hypothetical protein RJA69_2046 [Pseudomonadota bacterium]